MAHTDNLRNAIVGGLLILAQGSVVAPFIYTLFRAFNVHPWYFRFLPRQCCLLHEGQIIAAAQEERFTRKSMTRVSP